MIQLVRKQWFLIALVAVLSIGLTTPRPFLALANSTPLRYAIVTTVLFLMALPLEIRVVWRTIRYPWPALWGSVANMGLVPVLAWGASRLLEGDLAVGLLVTAAAPCTLASAAVWTRRAGGNDVTAILITLITNGTCFLFTPMWLAVTTQTETELDVRGMITRLAVLVVLPMALGQLVRIIPRVAVAATAAKSQLSSVAQLGILTMVLIGAVKSRMSLGDGSWYQTVSPFHLITMIAVVVALHVTALAITYLVARAIGFAREEAIASAFGGSQKTLMIGLYVAVEYFGGLTILPMLTYHIGQLVIDTVVADVSHHRSRRDS